MTEEVINQPASEEEVVTQEVTQQEEPQQVPLAALLAERKKRQELEVKNRMYEEVLLKKKDEPEPPLANMDEWVSRKEVVQEKEITRREILEQVFVESNPDKMKEIDTYLEKIVERKPWLAQSITQAPNRYARGYEIVQDYKHLVTSQAKVQTEAKRMVENSQKPGSPAAISSGSHASKSDFLMSIRGTSDFKKYRQEMLKNAR